MKNFDTFGIMLDCSRNAVMNVKSIKNFIDIIAKLGYNALMLYTEDTYEVENQPYFGYLRGRYTSEELKELDEYSAQKGIELIPCIQTLAHVNAIFRWPAYSGILDCNDILLAGDERVYKLIDDIFASLRKSFKSKKVNIGMDEAHMIGLGKYLDLNGYRNRSDILLEHLGKVSEIAKKYDFEPMMWSDMFFRLAQHGSYSIGENDEIAPEVRALVPENVSLVYWDYYSTSKPHYDQMIKAHQKFDNPVWFAGGAWKWCGFCPDNDFSIKSTKAAFESCIEHSVKNVFLTAWGDNGAECPVYSVLPSLFTAAKFAHGEYDMEIIKAEFKEMFSIDFDAFMLLDAPDSPLTPENHINNPAKYMLYNDLFLGIYDSTVAGGETEKYGELANLLKEYSNDGNYGYLFNFYSSLCNVLSLKYDLGLRTREAYDAKNKETLKAILGDYKELNKRIENFYYAFRKMWYIVNKPHGFDVQDIRIGGLMRRIETCAERLADFIDGKIDIIEELEEKLLDAAGGGDEFSRKLLHINNYSSNATVNIL